jgi:hypothetical protein
MMKLTVSISRSLSIADEIEEEEDGKRTVVERREKRGNFVPCV